MVFVGFCFVLVLCCLVLFCFVLFCFVGRVGRLHLLVSKFKTCSDYSLQTENRKAILISWPIRGFHRNIFNSPFVFGNRLVSRIVAQMIQTADLSLSQRHRIELISTLEQISRRNASSIPKSSDKRLEMWHRKIVGSSIFLFQLFKIVLKLHSAHVNTSGVWFFSMNFPSHAIHRYNLN